LQCGVFTKFLDLAIRAVRTIRTGGVINGSSTWRTDQLAYGGVKDSGNSSRSTCARISWAPT